MKIDSAFNTAEFAMQSTAMRMDRIASNIAKSSINPDSDTNLVNDMVDMNQTQRSFEANAKVLKTSDEMLNMLLGYF